MIMATDYRIPVEQRLIEAIRELEDAGELDLLNEVEEFDRNELVSAASGQLDSDIETTAEIARLNELIRIFDAKKRQDSVNIMPYLYLMNLTVYLPALIIFFFLYRGSDFLSQAPFILYPEQTSYNVVVVVLLTIISLPASGLYCSRQIKRAGIKPVPLFVPAFAAYITTLLAGAIIVDVRSKLLSPDDDILLLAIGVIIWLCFLGLTNAEIDKFRRLERLRPKKNPPSQKELNEVSNTVQDLLIGVVQRTIRQLETKYRTERPTPWQVMLPQYNVERPGRNLVERYEFFFANSTYEQLRTHLADHDKGSIGIAGERGIGKTSLMAALQKAFDEDQSGKYLTTWISSPTAFDEKEFLLSVLAQLATAAGAKLTGNTSWPRRNPTDDLERDDRIRRNNLLVVVWTTAVAAIAIVHFVYFEETTYQILGLDWDWKGVLLLLFVPAALLFVRLLRAVGPRKLKCPTYAWRPYVAASSELLEELWYERKDVQLTTWSFSYLGSIVRGRAGTEKTREPFTLPHLVQMWDDYLSNISGPNSPFEKVIVFVDELDKIPEVERIGNFLLVLKSLYSPANLFFVISISDDAYEVFQTRRFLHRRRNEFDSSVGHVERLRNMTHNEVYGLLEARILGPTLPYPATQLIWMLSEGNPRDAVRFARRLLTGITKSDERVVLPRIARTLWFERFGKSFSDSQWTIFDQAHPEALKVIKCYGRSFAPENVSHIFAEAIKNVKHATKADQESPNESESHENLFDVWENLLVKLLLALIIFELYCAEEWEQMPEQQVALLKRLHDDRRFDLVDEALTHLSDASPNQASKLLGDVQSLIDESRKRKNELKPGEDDIGNSV